MTSLAIRNLLEEEDADATMRSAPINTEAVNHYAALLAEAKTDARAFEPLIAQIRSDKVLKAGDVVAIAKAFAGQGARVTSKKTALDAIERRFVELVRFDRRNAIAKATRPW
ncbi:MAG: hypothetical protein ACFCUN_06625 [Hyphomicrobiaceae bacterium]